VALLWQRDRATRLSVEILQLTKHPIQKLESRAYRVALFADGQTDGQTHDDGMYRT